MRNFFTIGSFCHPTPTGQDWCNCGRRLRCRYRTVLTYDCLPQGGELNQCLGMLGQLLIVPHEPEKRMRVQQESHTIYSLKSSRGVSKSSAIQCPLSLALPEAATFHGVPLVEAVTDSRWWAHVQDDLATETAKVQQLQALYSERRRAS
jgi:hypothetical protein